MKSETIVMCVVALLLGMLLANMLKSVCGCKVNEGFNGEESGSVAPEAPPMSLDARVRARVREMTHPF